MRVVVSGPQSGANGAIDYGSSMEISGGFLVAAGSSRMAEAPGDSSSQYSLSITFDTALAAGTLVHIESADGEDVLTFAPEREFQSVVISSSALKENGTYTVYYGGSSTGTVKNGLYSGGTYSGGTKYTSMTVSAIVTKAGSSTSGNMNNTAPG